MSQAKCATEWNMSDREAICGGGELDVKDSDKARTASVEDTRPDLGTALGPWRLHRSTQLSATYCTFSQVLLSYCIPINASTRLVLLRSMHSFRALLYNPGCSDSESSPVATCSSPAG